MRQIFVLSLLFVVISGVSYGQSKTKKRKRVFVPKETELKFDGLNIDGELRNPGEFYFQYRDREKFKTPIGRKKNFHREMLRDVVMSR